MAEEIKLNKSVFNKKAYLKTIDTSFNELGIKTIQEQLDAQPTVQEFFDIYNTLFYNINELGPTLSHEFLIKTSSEYIGFEEDNELIALLQAEIASLREQLLASQQQLADFSALIPGAPELSGLNTPSSTDSNADSNADNILITDEAPTPVTPPTIEPLTNKQRVVEDFTKFSKSTIGKRSKRLNLRKSFIRDVKKENNL